VRLIGRGYDLQYWKADPRPMRPHFVDSYDSSRHKWIKEIFEPWRQLAFPGVVFYMGSCSDEVGIMHGLLVHPGQSEDKDSRTAEPRDPKGTLKEIVVYRYPRVFHVYDVMEYGRRFYRSLVFSSDSAFSPQDMPAGFVPIAGKFIPFPLNSS
jgi:hypothetical protein